MKLITRKPNRKTNQAILSAGYANYSKVLRRYAVSKTSNQTTSDDLIQDTFYKTWKYLMKGGKIDVMEAFLFHILKALVIDEYRKRKTTSLDILLEKGFEPSADDTARNIDMLDGKQIIELIAGLPLLYRKVMRMKYVQDLSINEISLITGQTRNTVAVQTHRGLEKLKMLYLLKSTAMPLVPLLQRY
jgi:RNA polymerase sigma-70 factor (ECF subfamily)